MTRWIKEHWIDVLLVVIVLLLYASGSKCEMRVVVSDTEQEVSP